MCNEVLISKIMIIIFTLVNLVMIGGGGVVFTLGLTGYWAGNQRFSHLMVGSSSLTYVPNYYYYLVSMQKEFFHSFAQL